MREREPITPTYEPVTSQQENLVRELEDFYQQSFHIEDIYEHERKRMFGSRDHFPTPQLCESEAMD